MTNAGFIFVDDANIADYLKLFYLIAYFGFPALSILLIVAYVCARDWHRKRKF
jgi:hypothetical protein